MQERIAKALLECVFYRVSAIVSVGENGQILGVQLFSTDWPDRHMHFTEEAKEVWLISNHPDGEMHPDEQDVRNYRSLVSRMPGVQVRLYLSSEYFSCFETTIL